MTGIVIDDPKNDGRLEFSIKTPEGQIWYCLEAHGAGIKRPKKGDQVIVRGDEPATMNKDALQIPTLLVRELTIPNKP
jgi:hypothetical protein